MMGTEGVVRSLGICEPVKGHQRSRSRAPMQPTQEIGAPGHMGLHVVGCFMMGSWLLVYGLCFTVAGALRHVSGDASGPQPVCLSMSVCCSQMGLGRRAGLP